MKEKQEKGDIGNVATAVGFVIYGYIAEIPVQFWGVPLFEDEIPFQK